MSLDPTGRPGVLDPLAAWTGLDRTVYAIDLRLGGWHVDLDGRAVFLLALTAGILAVAAVPVLASRRPELRRRWTTWALILPVIGVPMWLGPGPTALLAALLALQAVREFAAMTRLPRPETTILLVLAVAYPLAAWLEPDLLALVPLVALLCAVPAVLTGDVERGVERATGAAFASIWLCWSLAHLVLVGSDAFLLCFAAAAAPRAAGGTGVAFPPRPITGGGPDGPPYVRGSCESGARLTDTARAPACCSHPTFANPVSGTARRARLPRAPRGPRAPVHRPRWPA